VYQALYELQTLLCDSGLPACQQSSLGGKYFSMDMFGYFHHKRRRHRPTAQGNLQAF
jgi:hypothetical protein